MSKRRRLLIALAVLVACSLFALPSVHWYIAGLFMGEPCYNGRPTSYWSARIAEIRDDRHLGGLREPTALDVVREAVGLRVSSFGKGLKVLYGNNPDAVPVLVELLGDDDPHVVECAAVSLGMCCRLDDADALAALEALRRHPNLLARRAVVDGLRQVELRLERERTGSTQGPETVPNEKGQQ